MIDWKTTYTDQFQVRTDSDRLVGTACSKEHAEFIAEKGRLRHVWKWYEGRYVVHRTYRNGGMEFR